MAQTDWIWTLPWLCAFLWTAGGRQKGRWLRRIGVGIAVFIYSFSYTHNTVCFYSIPSFFVVTSIGYGRYIAQKNWLMIALIGTLYGAASFPLAIATQSPLFFGQLILAATGFTACAYFSNTGTYRLHWAIAEALTGLSATFLLPWYLFPK